jgi:hypothetical protein
VRMAGERVAPRFFQGDSSAFTSAPAQKRRHLFLQYLRHAPANYE